MVTAKCINKMDRYLLEILKTDMLKVKEYIYLQMVHTTREISNKVKLMIKKVYILI